MYDQVTENENVFKVIENKLRGLTEEIGGESGKKEVKQIFNRRTMPMCCKSD